MALAWEDRYEEFCDLQTMMQTPGDLPGVVALAELLVRPEWHARAACRDSGVSFFPERGQLARPAKELCMGCEVRQECLDYALSDEDCRKAGIWGGMSADQRAQLRH